MARSRNYIPKYKPPKAILEMLNRVVIIEGTKYTYRNNNGIIYAFNRLDNGDNFTMLIDEFKDLKTQGKVEITPVGYKFEVKRNEGQTDPFYVASVESNGLLFVVNEDDDRDFAMLQPSSLRQYVGESEFIK